MRYLLVLALALVVAGCQYTPQTPLGHALAALRAGDRDAFLKAKAEADAVLQKAWKPGDSVCTLSGADFEIRGEVKLIDKLDHADLFKLGAEQRFVYAAHVLGKYNAPIREAWFDSAFDPVLRPGFANITQSLDHSGANQCGAAQQTMLQLSSAGTGASEADRVGIMQEWQDALRQHDGNDAAYQHDLREALRSARSQRLYRRLSADARIRRPRHQPARHVRRRPEKAQRQLTVPLLLFE